MLDTTEFSPYTYFMRVMRYWWLVALATIVGGILGFIIYHLHGPLYEATATYVVTIDLEHFPIKDIREDMLQYNEDMALNTTKAILLSADVKENVIAQAKAAGIALTPYDLVDNVTIERKHDIWELRLRSRNPVQAQTIVNLWAHIGYQAMLSWQETGKVPDYVTFQPPTEALLPQRPVFYDRNRVVLAGAAIGFIAGLLSTNLIGHAAIRAFRKDEFSSAERS